MKTRIWAVHRPNTGWTFFKERASVPTGVNPHPVTLVFTDPHLTKVAVKLTTPGGMPEEVHEYSVKEYFERRGEKGFCVFPLN